MRVDYVIHSAIAMILLAGSVSGADPEYYVKKGTWQETMQAVFFELARILKPGGHVAFEVGEVRSGKIKLEEVVVPLGIEAGLTPELILINDQQFTKTAHCWGVDNNRKGTNTNRIVLFRRDRRRRRLRA